MQNLIDNMFTKRFCLPSDIDVSTLNKNRSADNMLCPCGNYHHIACIFKGKLRQEGKGRNETG